MPQHDIPSGKICSLCGAAFSCGADSAAGTCWCMDYPAIMPLESGQGCQCPDCLKNTIQEKLSYFVNNTPLDEALAVASHYSTDGKLVEGIDYIVEEGRWVFSRWYHLKRGYCCGNGCRHCPYEHVAVPQP